MRERQCSIDLRRVEFAWLPVALRLPFVQMLHGEGVPQLPMDSMLRRYRFVHGLGERFAMSTSRKFLCVNPMITERLRTIYPRHSAKIDTLWTWVNTRHFSSAPVSGHRSVPGRVHRPARRIQDAAFDVQDDRAASRQTRRAVEFHYVGTSNPRRFDEFAAIEDITICHGFKDAKGVAAILEQAHAGILTSEFEGMPRCVLETLAVGRPVVAVHLPQLETVIHDGESGYLVPREQSEDDLVEALARRFVDVRNAIADGQTDPDEVARKIKTFTPSRQLARVYRMHHEIQDGEMRL